MVLVLDNDGYNKVGKLSKQMGYFNIFFGRYINK